MGTDTQEEHHVLKYFLSGLSMRATGKIVGVSTQTVMRWIRQMHAKFVTKNPDITTVTDVEMDEMHH